MKTVFYTVYNDKMQIHIANSEIIEFCKKYPGFSVEKLVLDYITSVKTLQFRDESGSLSLPLLKEMIANTLRETMSDVTSSVTSVIKSTPNDLSLVRLEAINEKAANTGIAVKELSGIFEEYISSFKNPCIKGRNTEIKTVLQLETVFPKHEIIHVPSSKQKGKMDIILRRDKYPDVSIDTKNYNKTVPKTEVEKFEADMVLGKTHGILVSTNSKIACKPNFTISVIQGYIAIYLSENKDIENIKLAMDIIYNMNNAMTGDKGDIANIISEDTLVSIRGIITRDISSADKIRSNLVSCLDELKQMSFKRIIDLITRIRD